MPSIKSGHLLHCRSKKTIQQISLEPIVNYGQSWDLSWAVRMDDELMGSEWKSCASMDWQVREKFLGLGNFEENFIVTRFHLGLACFLNFRVLKVKFEILVCLVWFLDSIIRSMGGLRNFNLFYCDKWKLLLRNRKHIMIC